MQKKIDNLDINYIQYGNKNGENIVLLHGWNQNIQMMRPLGNALENNYYITIIDLPGHGESAELFKKLSLYDLVEIIHALLIQLNLLNPIIIGHSVGAELALLYASIYKANKIVIIDSTYYQKQWINKKKQTLLELTYNDIKNTNIKKYVKHIAIPVLIVWGKKDKQEPIKNAYKLKKLIVNSNIIIYNDSNHFAYLNHLGNLVLQVNTFLKLPSTA